MRKELSLYFIDDWNGKMPFSPMNAFQIEEAVMWVNNKPISAKLVSSSKGIFPFMSLDEKSLS